MEGLKDALRVMYTCFAKKTSVHVVVLSLEQKEKQNFAKSLYNILESRLATSLSLNTIL